VTDCDKERLADRKRRKQTTKGHLRNCRNSQEERGGVTILRYLKFAISLKIDASAACAGPLLSFPDRHVWIEFIFATRPAKF